MTIFSITRAVLLTPWAILCWLGIPFSHDVVGLAQKSDRTIRAEYSEKKADHYIPRLFVSAGLVIFTFVFLLISSFTGWTWMVLFALLICCVIVDVLLMTGRYAFFHEKSKEAEKATGNALALADSHIWKDTSLNGILKRAAEERKARDEQIAKLKKAGKEIPKEMQDEED